jgi:hypothetical protein
MDVELTFKPHVDQLVAKARARCAIFLKTFSSRQPALMLKFYTTYIRPLLEHNIVIWSPFSVEDCTNIENVQRYFTNKIPGCVYRPYRDRLAKLGLKSLKCRRLHADLIFLFKTITCSSQINLESFLNFMEPFRTRGHSLRLIKPLFNYERTKHSFIIRCVDTWNSLPPHAFNSSSLIRFRKILDEHIVDNYY